MAKKQTKKQLQAEVALTLQKTFSEFKDQLSDKKFNRNIRKASKIILTGIKLAKPTNNKIKEKPAARANKRTTAKATPPKVKESIEATE
ncbi:hypothetical protein [Flavihumibacter solisilvae]|uniref:Histone H1 n=1 Tax=Flavihumibacter solisilvae TaxID=1349421 RepID=A0A0C1L6A7_9BACT|nr:hypothetical protein [Flavihumibacter solisilvae]KIC95021.1 hypothetical protein OI18_09065 [Flavihumibacter solisilvae]